MESTLVLFSLLTSASAGFGAVTTTTGPQPYNCAQRDYCFVSIWKELMCDDDELTCIPRRDKPLASYGNIATKLNYKSNLLKHLPAEVFRTQLRDRAGLADVTELELSFNQLSQVDGGAFAGMDSLEKLSLASNDLKEVPTAAFAGLLKLKRLNIRNNQIEVIETEAFQPLKALEHLELSFCNIATLEPGAFQGLRNLIMLDLQHNRLASDSKSVTRDSFTGLPKLGTLKLGNNRDDFRLKDVNWMEAFGIVAARRAALRRSDEDDEEDYGDLLEFNTESIGEKGPEYYEVPCKCERQVPDPPNTVTCPLIWKFFKSNKTLECIGKARQPEYSLRGNQSVSDGRSDIVDVTALENQNQSFLQAARRSIQWLKPFWDLIIIVMNMVMFFLHSLLFN